MSLGGTTSAVAVSSSLTYLLSVASLPSPASAGIPEVDRSGQLFSPKYQMMGGGGSNAARGVSLRSRDRSADTSREGEERVFACKGGVNGGGMVQDVYEARFVAYLARFLLGVRSGGGGLFGGTVFVFSSGGLAGDT